jgi:poly-beta-1,6-N-acetyl-D-glucosamine synthase
METGKMILLGWIWLSIGASFTCLILFRNMTRREPTVNSFPPDEVSVIVPFRNEAGRIQVLLDSLCNQAIYPRKLIFVDDHSDDGSAEIVSQFFQNKSICYEVISMPRGKSGKKRAIFHGLDRVDTPYVITLDADVILPEGYFNQLPNPGVFKMITLPVYMEGRGIAGKWMELEYASFQLLQGSVNSEKPLMASGANLLFAKQAYVQFNDLKVHEHIASGDDQFALASFLRNKVPVRSCLDSRLVVKTETPSTIPALLRQRWRWMGNNTEGNDWRAVFFAFWVFVYNMGFLGLTVFYLVTSEWYALFVVILLKLVCDVLTYLPWFMRWNNWRLLSLMPLLAITYPLYLFALGAGYGFANVNWKSRKVR